MSDYNVERIEQRDILSVIKHISTITQIPLDNIRLIGSTGKSATSGDIDIACNANLWKVETVISLIEDDYDYVYLDGIKTLSIAIPVNRTGKNVQVDIMFVDNINWAQFAYNVDNMSVFKGAIRNILLSAVASTIYQETKDCILYNDEGLLLYRASRSFIPSVGLKQVYQHRPKSSSTGKYNKSMKSISFERFIELVPSRIQKTETIIIPEEATQLMFGEMILPIDISSAEGVMQVMASEFSYVKQQTIYERASHRCKPLIQKMSVPKAIAKYIY